MNATQIVGQVWNGLITIDGACCLLDKLRIRGAFDDDGFLGYDYATQRWLRIMWPNL